MVGGIGWFAGARCVVVGHQKGRTLNEQTEHNFGMAKPEGYRKAQRLFALAERIRLPVLTFVDTPGAYPGVPPRRADRRAPSPRRCWRWRASPCRSSRP